MISLYIKHGLSFESYWLPTAPTFFHFFFEWQRTSYALKKMQLKNIAGVHVPKWFKWSFLSNDSILNSPIENYSFKAHLRLPMSTETNTLTKGCSYVAVIITCCIFIHFFTKSRTSCLEFIVVCNENVFILISDLLYEKCLLPGQNDQENNVVYWI